MKNLRKIIALFLFIFITGILVTMITLNTSLNKTENTNKTEGIKKNTIYLLKTEKKTV
jgi:hypothetical protein